MKIYLIGMPGSGKTTIGKKLAEKLSYKFIDLDEYIELNSAMYIDEIFAAYDEQFFRDLETNMLKEVSVINEDLVISCGGGIVINKKNKDIMKGLKIFLDVPLEELENRVAETLDIRPLLKTKTINQIYLERKENYNYFTDIKIKNMDLNIAIEQIINEVENAKNINN